MISSNRNRFALLLVTAVGIATPLNAQGDSATANYVVSAETRSGMAAGSFDGSAAFGLALELGSTGKEAQPEAKHYVPQGLGLGASVPLAAPEASGRGARSSHTGARQKATGKMRVYWGCGENSAAGQSREVDFATIGRGGAPSGLQVKLPLELSARGLPGYAEWPNARDARDLQGRASLVGSHRVEANFAPGFSFDLASAQDFMAPLAATPSQEGNATRIDWQGVDRATGYFLSAIGTARDGTVIMWSSSDVAIQDSLFGQYLPSAEVARLVAARAVLPASVRTCTIPAEVTSAMETPMLMMTAFADDAEIAQSKPAGASSAWKPQWSVKLRYRSDTMLMLGEAGIAMSGMMASQSTDEDIDRPATPARDKSRKKRGLVGAIADELIGN